MQNSERSSVDKKVYFYSILKLIQRAQLVSPKSHSHVQVQVHGQRAKIYCKSVRY